GAAGRSGAGRGERGGFSLPDDVTRRPGAPGRGGGPGGGPGGRGEPGGGIGRPERAAAGRSRGACPPSPPGLAGAGRGGAGLGASGRLGASPAGAGADAAGCSAAGRAGAALVDFSALAAFVAFSALR